VKILATHDFYFRAPKGKKFGSASRTTASGVQTIPIPAAHAETLSVAAREAETYHFEFVTI